MEYPNSGSLVPSTIRKSEKSPDFFGSINVDPAYLKDLLQKSNGLVEIKLSGWKKPTPKNHLISITINNYKANEDKQWPKPVHDDGDVPF